MSAFASTKNVKPTKGTDKRSVEVLQPNLYSSFPSGGISVFNSGTSGLQSGLVTGTGFNFGSTISPAISYSSAGDFLANGAFGSSDFSNGFSGGIVTGAPLVGVSAVTAAPIINDASVVTSAPAVSGASFSTAAPIVNEAVSSSFGSGLVGSYGYGSGLGYSGLNSGSIGLGAGSIGSYGYGSGLGYSGLYSGAIGAGSAGFGYADGFGYGSGVGSANHIVRNGRFRKYDITPDLSTHSERKILQFL